VASIRIASKGPGRLLGGAAIPVPALDARAYQTRGLISGSPGIRRIPAPAPLPVSDQELSAQAMSGVIGLPSSSVQQYWLPSVYYTYGRQPHAPVSVLSDNQMPVPALSPTGLPAVMMTGPVVGGQQQVANPRVAPKFLQRR
jgi:hypothetical protein